MLDHSSIGFVCIYRLEVADLVLRMHRTVETNMPGQKFSVRVSATTLKGTPVSALTSVRLKKSTTLRAVARITDSPIGGVTVSNCSAKTGDLSVWIIYFIYFRKYAAFPILSPTMLRLFIKPPLVDMPFI